MKTWKLIGKIYAPMHLAGFVNIIFFDVEKSVDFISICFEEWSWEGTEVSLCYVFKSFKWRVFYKSVWTEAKTSISQKK